SPPPTPDFCPPISPYERPPMIPNSQFHPLIGLTEAEKVSANTREFEGSGTPYLKVPGLVSLSAVRVGQAEVPLAHEITYPVSAGDPPQMKTETLDLVRLETLADGTPVLLRNIVSNDGMWQTGVKVYVTGQWQGDKPV